MKALMAAFPASCSVVAVVVVVEALEVAELVGWVAESVG